MKNSNTEISVDYNTKFKELGNKITQIAKETKLTSSLCSALNTRLIQIDLKAQKRLSSLDKSFSSLKDEYLKLTTKYDSNTQMQKSQSLSNQSKFLIEKIQNQLQSQRESFIKYINAVFGSFENNLTKIAQMNNNSQVTAQANEIKNLFDNAGKGIDEKLNVVKSKREKFLNDFQEETKEEFGNVIGELENEANIRENHHKEFNNKCEEFEEQINKRFEKEKKSRQDFEENIFDLIEETCVKMTEDNK